jgi:hypothetical protein
MKFGLQGMKNTEAFSCPFCAELLQYCQLPDRNSHDIYSNIYNFSDFIIVT